MLAAIAVAWAVVILVTPNVRFVIYTPAAKAGVEIILGFCSLFASLVLGLFPHEDSRIRIRWVAAGFVVIGIGGLFYGYAVPLFGRISDPNAPMYGALIDRSVAGLLFAIGLLPGKPPSLTTRFATAILAAFLLLLTIAQIWHQHLPRLVNVASLESVSKSDSTYLHGLTYWHWTLSLIPLALAVAAAVGAAKHYPGRALGGWLLFAMTLWAGALFHAIFWPTAYSPIFTTSSVIRLSFTAVVLAGAVLELRRIAEERGVALAAHAEAERRLTELAVLRADFTAMVVHEVSSPLATIRMLSGILANEGMSHEQTVTFAQSIASEAGALEALFRDVQVAATVERDDFSLRLRPVPIGTVLSEAQSFTRTLPGDHPISFVQGVNVTVMADTERIGQVLRNLLSNAAKYSDPGTPIEVAAVPISDRLRVSIIDHGHGIHPEDKTLIFEKFGRGRVPPEQQDSGVGLGLYLSRRIIRSHGSDLSVDSEPGRGSVFSFELEIVS